MVKQTENDGGFKDANFHHPQGMTLHGNDLYVADTENHLIRKLDLGQRRLKQLPVPDKQAGFMDTGGMGTASSLNSPWDLIFVEGETLYCHGRRSSDLGDGFKNHRVSTVRRKWQRGHALTVHVR